MTEVEVRRRLIQAFSKRNHPEHDLPAEDAADYILKRRSSKRIVLEGVAKATTPKELERLDGWGPIKFSLELEHMIKEKEFLLKQKLLKKVSSPGDCWALFHWGHPLADGDKSFNGKVQRKMVRLIKVRLDKATTFKECAELANGCPSVFSGGDHPIRVKAERKALSLQPTFAECKAVIGKIYGQKDRFEKALLKRMISLAQTIKECKIVLNYTFDRELIKSVLVKMVWLFRSE